MLRALAVASCLACTCAEEAPVTQGRQLPRLAPAMPPSAGQPARVVRGPAPTRSLWGLKLGGSDSGAIEAFITARGLDCESAPAARRMTHQYRCSAARLPRSLTHRTPGDASSFLVMVRTTQGPLHHVSTLRHHSTPAAAIRDYQDASSRINSRLGKPTATSPAAPAKADFAAAQARFATSWTFSDLKVQLSIYKLGSEDVVVRERWDVPDVEAGVPPRPGTKGHAPAGRAGPHSPHGIVQED